MSTKSLLASGIAFLLVVAFIAGFAAHKAPLQPVGSSGADNSFVNYFRQGLYTASYHNLTDTISTLTASPSAATSTARTLTAAEVCQNEYVDMAFGNSTGTLTFPSAANLITRGQCLDQPGTYALFSVRNSSTTSTGFITYAAGASSSIVMQRGLVTATTTAGQYARFRLQRISSSTAPWILILQDTFQ